MMVKPASMAALLCCVVLFGAGCFSFFEKEQVPVVSAEDLACDQGFGSGPPTKEMGVCRLLHLSADGKLPKQIDKAQAEVLVSRWMELGALNKRVSAGEVDAADFQRSYQAFDAQCMDWVGLGCAELFFGMHL